ncbi:MAG TPA: OmpA family protein [Gammaproteobacteria bacterium]|nr:OmpA family protein [Gammaproteobacteria bacterium]
MQVEKLFSFLQYGFSPLRFILLVMLAILTGCASSNVTRDVTANVDTGVQNVKNIADNAANSNFADSYQNTSQATKGAILGGAAGAITGAFYAGSIGVIPGAATGLILGASYGSYIDANTSLRDQLENRGVNLVELGDQILIVVPSARLFFPQTANIKPQAYSTLNMLVQYINQYTKTLVKVAGYTSASGSPEIDLALSQQQAKHVAKFLLVSGVDARILFAEGYGGSRLIAKNSLNWDSSDNYRIEITLEKLYV